MAYTVPELPYAYNALEPYIDEMTMHIHHDKHHLAYVTNLNKALEGTNLGDQPVEKLISDLNSVPENIRKAVQNNGGGHYNHSLFWTIMGPNKGGKPVGKVAAAIDSDLGGFDKFSAAFKDAAVKQFGSGWSWLYIDSKTGKLAVSATANQDSPLMHGNTPILGVDVWEHAYYLKYQNLRPKYLDEFYNVIDWDAVEGRLQRGPMRRVTVMRRMNPAAWLWAAIGCIALAPIGCSKPAAEAPGSAPPLPPAAHHAHHGGGPRRPRSSLRSSHRTPAPRPTPEDAMRRLLMAAVKGDEYGIRRNTLDDPELALLWVWPAPADKMSEATALVDAAKFRHLKAGDIAQMPGGGSVVVPAEGVTDDHQQLLQEGTPYPMAVSKDGGGWKVDPFRVIKARNLAAHAREQAAAGASPCVARRPSIGGAAGRRQHRDIWPLRARPKGLQSPKS